MSFAGIKRILQPGMTRSLTVWGLLFLIFIGSMAWALYQVNELTKAKQNTTAAIAGMKLNASQITASFVQSLQGESRSLVRLEQQQRAIDEGIVSLRSGNAEEKIPELDGALLPDINNVGAKWDKYRRLIKVVREGSPELEMVSLSIDEVKQTLPQINSLSNDVIDILVASQADQKLLLLASNQLVLIQKIENDIARIMGGDTDALSAADDFGQDIGLFNQTLESMLNGNPSASIPRISDQAAREHVRKTAIAFTTVDDNAEAILRVSPLLFKIKRVGSQVSAVDDSLNESIMQFETAIDDHYKQNDVWFLAALISGALALLSFLILIFSIYRITSKQLRDSHEKNDNNQRAILRLLDEMSALAEGDLSVNATITEDITGAIADSVNYAIEALRGLVRTIHDTSNKVAGTAEETRDTAQHLAKATKRQSRQMTSASAAVSDMSRSIKRVSENASESAEVAEQSVEIAHAGAGKVHKTIAGMLGIRQQIQDTSKRIKRLGESSQEIGNIVGLINDIADQTNILALNAAIQASAAGEAGRGFAVVADEVQRLAERSANATRQIEVLVKTIQADTNEAVASMEQSTTQVVEGTKNTEETEHALAEIEAVSKKLAGLIQSISNESSEQSASSTRIALTMEAIRDITSQTSAGTAKTAVSIDQLADLSQDMKRSVAGFKLPEASIEKVHGGVLGDEILTAEAVFSDEESISNEELDSVLEFTDESANNSDSKKVEAAG